MNIRKRLYSFLVVLLSIFLVSCKPEGNGFETPFTDSLKLNEEYEGKSFLTQGIEAVTLHQAVDGDTAHFIDSNGSLIKIRFLGINTPESTGKISPWGKQAGAFAKEVLNNAVEIVIESEEVGKPAVHDSTNERYLAYVWYRPSKDADFRNLNLETIEQCFSFFTGLELDLKYGDSFESAFQKAYTNKKRVFGEKDPEFDYTGEIRDTTIAQLRHGLANFSTGSRLRITVRVVRLIGNSLYVEDVEASVNEETGVMEKAGIFLYHSFVSALGKYEPGDVVSLECQASDTDDYGFQLVNASNLRTIEKGTDVEIRVVPEDVTSLRAYEGLVVQINEFIVTKVGNQNSETKAFTIYGKFKNGAEVQVRIDGDASPKLGHSVPVVGTSYKVIGGVSKFVDRFNDNTVIYQIKLGNQKGVGLYDFIKSNN